MKIVKSSPLTVILLLSVIVIQSPSYAQQQPDRIGEMGIFYEGRSFETVYQEIISDRMAPLDLMRSLSPLLSDKNVPTIDIDLLPDLGNVPYPIMILNPDNDRFEIDVQPVQVLIQPFIDTGFAKFNSHPNRGLEDLVATVLDGVSSSDLADIRFLADFLRYFDMGLFPFDSNISPENDPLSIFNGIAGESAYNFLHNLVAERINQFLLQDLNEANQPLFPYRYRPGNIVKFEREDNGKGFVFVENVITEYYSPVTYRLFWYQYRDWEITINEGGFNVLDRGSVNSPFPDLADVLEVPEGEESVPITIPEFMLDPIDLRGVWARELEYKIHAHHLPSDDSESPIVVNSVVERDEIRVLTRPEGSTLSFGPFSLDPSTHRIFAPNRASCIDIFTGKVEEEDSLGTLISRAPRNTDELKKKGYCLGRCAFPAIINSY